MSKPAGPRWVTTSAPADESIRPDGVIGPFLTVTLDEIDVFNDAFSDEIDSDFASSICCCDACYADFRAHWPDVAFREMEFQTQSMEVFYAVDHSRLPGIWSPAEISTLRHFVQCGRCMEFATHNIWIYEHTFSDAEKIEVEIDQLLTIGDQTPFLLLEHEFARRVLAHIRSAVIAPDTLPAGQSLYRARVSSSIAILGQATDALVAYAPPPARYVQEGRFNHAGTPMLYLASTPEVAAAEIGMPGEQCHIAELRTLRELTLLDLANLDEEASGYALMRALASSALVAAPRIGEGWQKKQYVFSRFVADCARSAGYDAIRYASTKNIEGKNIVILAPSLPIDGMVSLVSVREMLGLAAAKRY
ncbi:MULTISPECIES: RES family NAD+ phosphorylase [unclassified Mesorhizobium]|uniref:RES family NAD+ phosphorylase n=1 Tax=unclassified Mesorhizobium TaxID=325217 RepID=UPI0010922680|nr:MULTISPECIES: RES family NAD+ phosphorylase [unclassified Mesorhizobium]TGP85633.1 RES domain-containing protein [Mesorhizobium sp. M8A.F.Ca.ET.218.01.1.1]TGT14784.1 RES domain-containing protein [Mesorhizobium sp. M8A.F.Ca.ET.213.01.1.1]